MLEDLWTLSKIVFLGETILLTSAQVDIENHYVFEFKEPTSIVTSGAHLLIETAETKKGRDEIAKGKNWQEVVNNLKLIYPAGSITAKLYSKGEEVFFLTEVWPSVDEKHNPVLWIMAARSSPLSEGKDVVKIEILSQVPLKKADIKWVNYSK